MTDAALARGAKACKPRHRTAWRKRERERETPPRRMGREKSGPQAARFSSATANPVQVDRGFATPLASPVRPIARFTTPCAICRSAALPSGAGCVRSRRSPKRSAANRGAMRRSLRPVCCVGSTGLRGRLHAHIVHVLFSTCEAYRRPAMAMHQPPERSGHGNDGPSPERRQHGPVERIERAIGDAAGNPSRPYRVNSRAIVTP